MRVLEEVTDQHIIIWFISNLLLADKRHIYFRENYTKVEEKMKNIITTVQEKGQNENFDLIEESKFHDQNQAANEAGEEGDEIKEGGGVEEKGEDNEKEAFLRPPGVLETYSNIHKLSQYVPLVKVVNHFYNSLTDYVWLEQQSDQAPETDKLLSKYCIESQVEEITFELLMMMSIQGRTEETNRLFTSSNPASIVKNDQELIKLILG
jgi:hypothetical protein